MNEALTRSKTWRGINKTVTTKNSGPTPEPANTDHLVGNMAKLLSVEAAARNATNEDELRFLIANETRHLIEASQVFVFSTPVSSGKIALSHATGVSEVNNQAPVARVLTRHIRAQRSLTSDIKVQTIQLDELVKEGEYFPFSYGLIVPVSDHKQMLSFALLVRNKPFDPSDLVLAERLSSCYIHASKALGARPARKVLFSRPWRLAMYLTAIALLTSVIQVPLTVVVPATIIAKDPIVMAAPLDGVVDKIHVEPNAQVNPGDLLFTMVDTDLRGEFEVSSTAVEVAQAKLNRLNQGAYASADMRREVLIGQAELELAKMKQNWAANQLQRTTVIAEHSGVLIFERKDVWTGKPVSTGEKILEIADPNALQILIDLPIGDSTILDGEGKLRLFLDSDPINPVGATIASAGYVAMPNESGQLSYPVIAKLDQNTSDSLRIGLRGSAQIYGEKVSLAYFLLRRPLVALRQGLGL